MASRNPLVPTNHVTTSLMPKIESFYKAYVYRWKSLKKLNSLKLAKFCVLDRR